MGTLIAGGYWLFGRLFGPTGQAPTTTATSQLAATADVSKTGSPSEVTTTWPPAPIVAPAKTEAPPPTEIHAGATPQTHPPATAEDQIPPPAETQAPSPPQPPAADSAGPAPSPRVSMAPEPPAAAPPTSSQETAASAIPASGGKAAIVSVQLASMATEAAAKAEWQRLHDRMPDLLGSRQPDISKDERHGRTWWRLRTGGFEEAAQATEFCGRLRAKGLNCFVTTAD